jgi:hypothetical protein
MLASTPQYSAMISQYATDIKPIIDLILQIRNGEDWTVRKELERAINDASHQAPDLYFPEQHSSSDEVPSVDHTILRSMLHYMNRSIRIGYPDSRESLIAPIGSTGIGPTGYAQFVKENHHRAKERIDVLVFILQIPIKSQTDTNDQLYDQFMSYITAFLDSKASGTECCPDTIRDIMIHAFKTVCRVLHDLKQKEIQEIRMTQLFVDVGTLLQENAKHKEKIGEQEIEINRLKANVDFLGRTRHATPVEYDYAMIRKRIDPIRSELKVAQRIFARVIRNTYTIPVAVMVGPAK